MRDEVIKMSRNRNQEFRLLLWRQLFAAAQAFEAAAQCRVGFIQKTYKGGVHPQQAIPAIEVLES